ncbi:MAG: membrane protein [Bacteroidetes bacterium OLB12]|nr:MAG: membrane protein [Bacteroidetes bacterium OLB12]
MKNASNRITRWLDGLHPVWFTIYASITAFALYTCVFAFRKAFPAATYSGLNYAGLDYKSWLVISQVLGYGAAKFVGIKTISELKAHSRSGGILLMVSIAALAWFLFAIVPAPYNIIFLFINGFPLGMVWGMVFGYLEGRRMTEVLGASLAVSFIFSSGLCRSAGAYVMLHWGTSEYWMPFVVCCLFTIPLLLFLYLLDKLPPPSAEDERLRTKRKPMNGDERRAFTKTFLPGIVLFTLCYVLLTAFRDFRDNFSREIWDALGQGNDPSIYTQTEIPVSLVVLICMGSLMIIKNNKLALMINHLIIATGMILIGVANLLFQAEAISPLIWMTLVGIGLYLGYIPFNSIFFDRLIAAFKYVSTVGFIMYVADAFGYVGSIAVLFYKNFFQANLSWLDFFISGGYVMSVVGTVLILASMLYFHYKHKAWQKG